MSTKFDMARTKYSAVKHEHYKKKPKQIARRISDDDSGESNDDKKKRTQDERLRRERLSKGYECLRKVIGAKKKISNNEVLVQTAEKLKSLHQKYEEVTKKCLQQQKLIDKSSLIFPVNVASSEFHQQVDPEDEDYVTTTDDEDTDVDIEGVESDSNGAEYSRHMNSILTTGISELAVEQMDEESSSDSE